MPPFGDHYESDNIKNPFEERVVPGYTAQQIATLQSRLTRQLGPEYISERRGNGGGQVAYLEGHKAISLANEVFGFNGWSSSLQQVQVDFVDEHPQNGRVNLGLSIVVRITLKDGTYHEDIGYGNAQNVKGKADAFQKAKKEAATDGLKRALRTFGNALGNCLYDKAYLTKIKRVKSQPVQFKESELYRPQGIGPQVKEESTSIKREPPKSPKNKLAPTDQPAKPRNGQPNISFSGEFDDEYDGNLFDEVEFTEHGGDEFSLDSISAVEDPVPKAKDTVNGPRPTRSNPLANGAPPRQQPTRMPPGQSMRNQLGVQYPGQQPNQEAARPPMQTSTRMGPQTPNPTKCNAISESNKTEIPPIPANVHKPPTVDRSFHETPHNQQSASLRPTPPHAQNGYPKAAQGTVTPTTDPPPAHKPPPGFEKAAPQVGFVTSRAADMMRDGESAVPLSHLPAFNPQADSPVPKDQRTPGIDYTRSRPTKWKDVGAPTPPILNPKPNGLSSTKHANNQVNTVSASGQNSTTNFRPVGPSASVGANARSTNSNYVNPQFDANRKIGAPMSPSLNRGAYKPPSMVNGVKRERAALQDVSNQHGTNANNKSPNEVEKEGPEAKKQKFEPAAPGIVGAGAENMGASVNS